MLPPMKFLDPWNPTHDEILRWAFDRKAFEPTQDFDLALSWAKGLERTYLELASDDDCPKQRFFLAVLYLMVGDAVRGKFRSIARPKVEGLIDRGDAFDHPLIRLWQTRSRRLLEHPKTFSYAAWCGGGLARDDAPPPSGED
jgi:hypothetical protein